MSNYVKATNFATKDTLPTGDSNKIVKGTEIDNEFNSIVGAIASKADNSSPTFTGTVAVGGALNYTGTLTGGTGVVNLGSGQFYKDADGNIGIGNTNPSFSLGSFEGIVMQSQGISSQFRLYTSDSSGLTETDGATFSVYSKELFISNKENADVIFEANDVEAMRIKANGNVGIGTGVPSTRLTLQGTSTASAVTNYTDLGGLTILGSTAVAGTTGIGFSSGGGGGAGIGFGRDGGFGTSLSFYTNASGVAGGMTEGMRLLDTGNLTVQGTATASNFGLGFSGQTWQNMAASRAVGTTYTNSLAYPIQVIVTLVNTSGAWFYINGNLVIRQFYDVNTGAGQTGYSFVSAIIPPGATYQAANGNLSSWYELR